MDGWDMIKGGVYKKRKVDKERDLDTSIKKQRKKQEEHLEKREWTVIIPINCGLLGLACEDKLVHLSNTISLFFLVFVLGRRPPLVV